MTKRAGPAAGPSHSSRRRYGARATASTSAARCAPRATKTAAERLNHVDVALEEAVRRGKTNVALSAIEGRSTLAFSIRNSS